MSIQRKNPTERNWSVIELPYNAQSRAFDDITEVMVLIRERLETESTLASRQAAATR